jgi:hypothetical protein
MAIEFPANPAAQTPANTFSPTSTPLASPNDVTYTWDGVKWEAYKKLDPSDFYDLFVEVAGDDMSGNLTLGTDKIVLNAGDGSTSFAGGLTSITSAGQIQSYQNPVGGAGRGVFITNGLIAAGRRDHADVVFQGYVEGTVDPTATIDAGGNIKLGPEPSVHIGASGFVQTHRGNPGIGTGQFTGGSNGEVHFQLTPEGVLTLDETDATLVSSNVVLSGVTGSGSFKGGLTCYAAGTSEGNTAQQWINSDNVKVIKATGAGSLHLGGDTASNANIILKGADGTAYFRERVTSGVGIHADVVSSPNPAIRAKRTDDNSAINFAGANISGINVFRVQANGELQIGTTSTDQNVTLKPDGNAYKRAGGTAWSSYSDVRLKENVAPYEKGLTAILEVNPVTFDFINGAKDEISVIAQDIEVVFPECVSTISSEMPDGSTADDVRTFNPTGMQFALINAVKELSARIEALEAKVQASAAPM